MSRTAAILLAAGSSKRMQGAVTDKVLVPLGGRPLFAHSVAAFMESGVADLYIVTTRDQRQLTALSAYAPTPAIFVRGGRTRQASVAAALEALPPTSSMFSSTIARAPLCAPNNSSACSRSSAANTPSCSRTA
nr:NTP transferase domain-containing protein [Ereboglobus luteus]